MKYNVMIIFMLMVDVNAFAQKEHLQPAPDFKKYEGVLKTYYDSVFPSLYAKFSEKPFVRYTAIPSFSKEYAFSLEEKDGRYFIVSNTFNESFWYSRNRSVVRVLTTTKEISVELYKSVGYLFQVLAEGIKKPEKQTIGLDGTMYYFATTAKNGVVKIGETWSPDKKTLLQRLVKACNSLYAIGEGKDINELDLNGEVEKLVNELKKQGEI